MQPAEFYLKRLLFDYDCVTIPGLGGFIMQSNTALINRGKNRISPPSRTLSFNSLLNHDDGLLISAMARAEQISYKDAGLRIKSFVEDTWKKLSRGEIIRLEGIGEFSSGPDSGIRFRQADHENFFAGSFGMYTINLYPLTRPEHHHARITKKPADRKLRQVDARRPASVKWTLIFSIPLILFLLYGIIFPRSIQDIYTNYSGLVIDFINPDEIQPPATTYAFPAPAIINEPEVEAEIITPAITETVVITPEPEPVIPVSPKYYIIGGCFENEDNAGKFLAELISRGFEAEKAGTNNRGHVRISYKSFPEKATALPYLQKIRNEENASAWLLKY